MSINSNPYSAGDEIMLHPNIVSLMGYKRNMQLEEDAVYIITGTDRDSVMFKIGGTAAKVHYDSVRLKRYRYQIRQDKITNVLGNV